MDVSVFRAKYNERDNVFLEENIEVKEPLHLFEKWFNEVCKNPAIIEPNAMCLSTATRDGRPSARFVLCKGFGNDGFRFFTHYTSRKGQELEENPNAALTFFWPQVSRSIRIEGCIEKLPINDADTYFQSRPYQSQIGALSSAQSERIASRYVLSKNESELKSRYPPGEVPRPPQWGGYILKPHYIEFWQGQSDRIHDRILFRKPNNEEEIDEIVTHVVDDGWLMERLAP